MGKYDRDRFQKELSVNFCLARGMVPFLEVVVPSISELSDTTEVLTDLDVVGVEFIYDSRIRRVFFDCKTSAKMSPVNRAFWARGVADYTRCDEAIVFLKTRAVHNHRISTLKIDVDLHDEASFRDLGTTLDPAFGKISSYQASIDRWNEVFDAYSKATWSESLFDISRNVVPLSQNPTSTFRSVIAYMREVRGHFDPSRNDHVGIFLDAMSSVFILWSSLGRDIRRFFDPGMDRSEFERTLRYYIWGGRDSYTMRQQMRKRVETDAANNVPLELPGWDKLISFAGTVVSSPQDIFKCSMICREMSFKLFTGGNAEMDKSLAAAINNNKRARQFTTLLADFLVSASGIPLDMEKRVNELFLTS
jgi:hypothetical protein